MKLPNIALLVAVSISFSTHGADSEFATLRIPPKEPAESAKTIRALDGFHMDLLASEPLVTSPVAMIYDENGKAYVAEMNDYPYTDKKNDIAWKDNTADAPIGRIRLLEDTNGDGVFDKSYIFAELLSWPTGIAPWKGGIFVAATPDIWYFKDTKGDHKADVRIKVYTGFRKYNIQAVMNNLVWGLDHKIYGAGGGNGATVLPGDQPNAKPVVLTRNDFRFDAVSGFFEAISGGARFGNTFDDWGNRFICNIRNPCQQVVLPANYLARNPYLPVGSALKDAAESSDVLPVYRLSPPEPWRTVRAKRWAGEADHKYPRSETAADGYFTSTSGITIYRGAAYPKKYYGNVFLGEVAGNLVHRQVMTPNGVTFDSVRADQKTEFVASMDNWFRPVNYVNAPDGTLHVLDMYRETIEHPWSIPDDIKAQLDLTSGRDRGRIYRLTPPGFKSPRPPQLGKASTAELVATLENPNSWWRDTAHRLLFERQDKSAIKPLRKLFLKSRNPIARLYALWSLEGLGALTDADISHALSDEAEGMREQGVKLAETRFKQSPALLKKVLGLADDPEIRVRFQTAFTLGESSDARVPAALAVIAKRDAGDSWVRTAVLSSAVDAGDQLLSRLVADKEFSLSAAGMDLERQLALVAGARNLPEKVNVVLNLLGSGLDESIQKNLAIGLGDGLKRAGKSLTQAAEGGPAGGAVQKLFSEAQKQALDDSAAVTQRQQSIQLLGYDDFARVEAPLKSLLNPAQPQEVQMAALHTLSAFQRPQVAGILLEQWRGYTPAIRGEAIEALLARKERLKPLLDAIESGKVPASQIPAVRKTKLMAHADPAIRDRATALFSRDAGGSRKEVIEKFKPALALKGDKVRGHKIYEATCMTCHRVGEQGKDVGPNLATIRAWDSERAMVNILDPNREVAPNFVQYEVELKNGESTTGLIASETASSITLNRAEGVQETILRQNIAKISSSGLSLMPEGIEGNMTQQDMADLLAFLLSAL